MVPPAKPPKSFTERLRERLRNNDPGLLKAIGEIADQIKTADPELLRRAVANAEQLERQVRKLVTMCCAWYFAMADDRRGA
jgi:hypothetical protein